MSYPISNYSEYNNYSYNNDQHLKNKKNDKSNNKLSKNIEKKDSFNKNSNINNNTKTKNNKKEENFFERNFYTILGSAALIGVVVSIINTLQRGNYLSKKILSLQTTNDAIVKANEAGIKAQNELVEIQKANLKLQEESNKLLNDKSDGDKIKESVKKYIFTKSDPTGFKDVAGMKETKDNFNKFIIKQVNDANYLENCKKFKGKPPEGFILYGPPGTGKTFIVKALAKELDTDLYILKGSDFNSSYIHESSTNFAEIISSIKEEAKNSKKPVLLFLDEIDSLIPNRNKKQIQSHETEEVNEMLQQLDHLRSHNIILLGATNRLESLDSAAIRSGRFGKNIKINNPDKDTIRELINIYYKDVDSAKNLLENKSEVNKIIDNLYGLSNASIDQILSEAGIKAANENADKLNSQHILSSISEFKKTKRKNDN